MFASIKNIVKKNEEEYHKNPYFKTLCANENHKTLKESQCTCEYAKLQIHKKKRKGDGDHRWNKRITYYIDPRIGQLREITNKHTNKATKKVTKR